MSLVLRHREFILLWRIRATVVQIISATLITGPKGSMTCCRVVLGRDEAARHQCICIVPASLYVLLFLHSCAAVCISVGGRTAAVVVLVFVLCRECVCFYGRRRGRVVRMRLCVRLCVCVCVCARACFRGWRCMFLFVCVHCVGPFVGVWVCGSVCGCVCVCANGSVTRRRGPECHTPWGRRWGLGRIPEPWASILNPAVTWLGPGVPSHPQTCGAAKAARCVLSLGWLRALLASRPAGGA
mmetsp:Transcript_37227/g.61135  ORF Transcript_37227/g.61135 Transcript_37227/m.61135 type:complete len:241 (+) Transcript_37227:225-947(+)